MENLRAMGTLFVAATTVLSCLWPGAPALRGQITGGMHDPAIDVEGEPFSYFWHPTDMIGALFAPVASEVTPEGYVYTGFGELMFFVGNPPQPVNKRIKTLHKGYLPIVQYEFRRHGVRYHFRMFGADLGGRLEGLPVNFVEVEVSNEIHEKRAAFVSSAYRFTPPSDRLDGRGGSYRFHQAGTSRARPTTKLHLGLIPQQYLQGQGAFNANWKYGFARNALTRDGRIVYWFPSDPQPHQVSLALGDTGLRAVRYFTGEVRDDADPQFVLEPHTPMGMVTYRIQLQPGERRSLVFKMPIVPLPEGSPEARQVDQAGYEAHFQQTVAFWEELVGRSAPLHFPEEPEEKVQHYLLANTIFDLLDVDKVGEHYYMNVNKFQYHDPYGGATTVNMSIALDYMGLHDIAGKTLLHRYQMQYPDGSFHMGRMPEHLYWELFGYTLWGWPRHYQLTRDEDFLAQVYPGVVKAIQWHEQASGKTPWA